MTELTINKVSRAGVNPDGLAVAAAAGGDNFVQAPKSNVFLYVANGGASSIDVTVSAVNTTKQVPNYGNLSASDAVVSVPAGEHRLIGPFPFGVFESDVQVSYSDVSSVTVAALRFPSDE